MNRYVNSRVSALSPTSEGAEPFMPVFSSFLLVHFNPQQ